MYGRSGYTDDEAEHGQLAMWRGNVANAMRGKRGQAFLLDLVRALDAMPVKQLIKDGLVDAEGGVCALGAVGVYRGLPLTNTNTTDYDTLGDDFNIARQLAQEVMYINDEFHDYPAGDTPELRWQRMREWAVSHLLPVEDAP